MTVSVTVRIHQALPSIAGTPEFVISNFWPAIHPSVMKLPGDAPLAVMVPATANENIRDADACEIGTVKVSFKCSK
jgi:hypothetical protein